MFKRGLLSSGLTLGGYGTTMRTSSAPSTCRKFTSTISRTQQQRQSPQTEQSNSIKEGMSAFRPLGSPFLKVFLGAIFTYQVVYYTWKKLETSEKKFLKNEEIKTLEKQAKELTAANAK